MGASRVGTGGRQVWVAPGVWWCQGRRPPWGNSGFSSLTHLGRLESPPCPAPPGVGDAMGGASTSQQGPQGPHREPGWAPPAPCALSPLP